MSERIVDMGLVLADSSVTMVATRIPAGRYAQVGGDGHRTLLFWSLAPATCVTSVRIVQACNSRTFARKRSLCPASLSINVFLIEVAETTCISSCPLCWKSKWLASLIRSCAIGFLLATSSMSARCMVVVHESSWRVTQPLLGTKH